MIDTVHNRHIEQLPKQFYQQLLLLLEFTRDMDRNKNDSEFATKEHNTIHYVFDENIFELFIGAHIQFNDTDRSTLYLDRRKYSAVFHLEAWRERLKDSSSENKWIRANRKTAIVAAEYLVSGKLPGQKNQRIYITEWHFKEFTHRVRILHDHFQRKIRNARAKKTDIDLLQDRLKTLTEVASSRTSGIGEILAQCKISAEETKDLGDDLTALTKARLESLILRKIAVARAAAEILVDDDYWEPFQQIRRLYEKEIASRLAPLGALVRPSTPAEIGELRVSTIRWDRLIRAEEANRGVEKRRRRTASRVATDAQSLALIQWAAKNIENPENNRVVFVTGDSLLFDAYRRWWLNEPEEPFTMRRVVQYAPILNFRDSAVSFGFDGTIFENTRNAIEPILFYFNLSEKIVGKEHRGILGDLSANSPEWYSRDSGREFFALLLKERNPLDSPAFRLFAEKIDLERLTGDREIYRKIRNEWQGLERMAVGVNFDLVGKRLDDPQRALLWNVLNPGVNGSSTRLANYINEQLEAIYVHSASLFVPATFAALRDWQAKVGNYTTRVPIALRLRSHEKVPRGIVSIVDNLVSLQAGDNSSSRDVVAVIGAGAWYSHPESLFAVAAVTALRLALWTQAVAYADMAVRSDAAREIAGREDSEERGDYFELLYLRAIASRFEMGDIKVGAQDGEVRSRKLLDGALNDLNLCVDYHRDGPHAAASHILREMRAFSEKAALRLFFVSWLLRSSFAQPEASFEREPYLGELWHAHSDLLRARDLLSESEQWVVTSADKTESLKIFGIVKDQIMFNLAAWYVFFALLGLQPKMLTSSTNDIMAETYDYLVLKFKSSELGVRAPVSRAEISAFLVLYGNNVAARVALESLDVPPDIDATVLALDRDIVALLKKEVPPTS